MISKQHEIEAIVEDLIENTVFDLFADSFSTSKDCIYALEILKYKLEELDPAVFKEIFE